MKPPFPVTTHVKIGSDDDFRSLPTSKVKIPKISPPVISSHKFWLAAICLFSCPFATNGSSVAIILTDSQIMIGADGALTAITSNVPRRLSYCKIQSEGKVFYAATGLYDMPEGDLSLWALLRA